MTNQTPDPSDLVSGQMVKVLLPRHVEYGDGDPRDARVLKVPPFDETVVGETRTVEDEVRVQYPNTSIDGGNLFGDIQENVPLDAIVEW